MAESDGQEKTEEATPRKQQQSREKGQVPRSKELGTAAVLIMAAFAMVMFGDPLARALVITMKRSFTLDREQVYDTDQMLIAWVAGFSELIWPVFAILVALFIAGVIGAISLGGVIISAEAARPKWSKISPAAGLKRMFGVQALVELIKSIAKVAVIGGVAWGVLAIAFGDILALNASSLPGSAITAMEMLRWMFIVLCCSLVIIVVIDVPYQIWNHAKQLKMTKQEIKDEYKDSEGKPEVKQRIRQLQMEASQRRMMSDVPDADVIVTNPSHYSIALKYDKTKTGAPFVVAKGVDQIALKVREIAREYEVPVMRSPQLCRAIYHTTEIGDEIPEELFNAVAQILAYIYQLEQFRQRKAKRPTPLPPELPIPDDFKY